MSQAKPRSRAVNFYKPGQLLPNDSVAYLMKRVIASVGSQADAELEPQGLTHAQWVPLFKLYLGHASTAAALAGCASYKGIEPEAQFRTPESLGLQAGTQASAPQIASDWWRTFGDEQLDRLVAQALQGNPTLKVAQARLRRAQSVMEVARSAT